MDNIAPEDPPRQSRSPDESQAETPQQPILPGLERYVAAPKASAEPAQTAYRQEKAVGGAGKERADKAAPPEKLPRQPLSVETVKQFFIDYYQTARSVCLSPIPFFEEMPRKGGYSMPAKFLAVSACGHAFVHFLWHPDLLAFAGDTAFTMCIFLLLAGGIVSLLKHFERPADMEEVYRVLAYASPPLLLMGFQWLEIPGLIYMAVLWFLGLKTLYDR